MAQGPEFFLRSTGDRVRAQQMKLRGLQELRDRQAAALAYLDVFWSSAVVAALMVFLVPPDASLGGREGRPCRRRVNRDARQDAGW